MFSAFPFIYPQPPLIIHSGECLFFAVQEEEKKQKPTHLLLRLVSKITNLYPANVHNRLRKQTVPENSLFFFPPCSSLNSFNNARLLHGRRIPLISYNFFFSSYE